ncbi:MAG TPA: VWA domain-containing protein, partial [Sorangium sp.]|nr:VWA domain-containing protein [Sorangium sp.]
ELAADQAKVKESFDKIAAKIEAHMKRFYLLSYCTPARAGEHEVEIKAISKDPSASGSLEYKFNADGFGPPPECDPNTPPSFDLKATAPAPDSDGGGSGGAKASFKASAGAKVEAK